MTQKWLPWTTLLSRYPSTQTTSDIKAQTLAHHPSFNFDYNKIILLNREKSSSTPLTSIASLSSSEPTVPKTITTFTIDDDTVNKLRAGYKTDTWCQKLISASRGMPNLLVKDGLWFLGERLIIPADCGIREQIFRLAHDNLGHYFRTQLLLFHNSEETESFKYVSRMPSWYGLIFTPNLIDILHVQDLLLKFTNTAPWDKPIILPYLIKTSTKTSYEGTIMYK